MTSCLYEGTLRQDTEVRHEYVATLKKEVFKKFFHILKNSGTALLRINNQALLEMNFNYDKCPLINVCLETPSRSI